VSKDNIAIQGSEAQEYLFALYDRMIGDPDIPSVLQNVAEVVRQDLGAERATVYLIDESTQELEAAAIIGNVARTIRIPIQESSLAGYCALTGRAFVVDDAYQDLSYIDPKLRFDRFWDKLNQFRTRDVLCAPALFKGKVMGVVQVLNSREGTFDQANLRWLQHIARLIGYALYHAKLHNDIATLKQLETEKAKFMRVMVHELKSPVATTKMLADTYRQFHNVHPKMDALTAKVSDRMTQLQDLITGLLELSKVKSGEPLGEITVLDLAILTTEVAQEYQDQARQKGLEMTVDVPETPLEIRFDQQGCQLVLSNLISNAIKYTASGSVRIHLTREESWAVLEVADSGIGIPEKDIPKMFQEFFRASNAKTNRIQGSGVGLAGAKNLVDRFGGQLELTSRENEGSTFTVRLALYQPNNPAILPNINM
jgi:signal transduction histidine kinase